MDVGFVGVHVLEVFGVQFEAQVGVQGYLDGLGVLEDGAEGAVGVVLVDVNGFAVHVADEL